MNKADAVRREPSVCTTTKTITTNFMQVMHVHKWTPVGTAGLIIVNGQNIKKIGFGNSIFVPQRVENCTSRLCPRPLPASKNTEIGGGDT